MERKERKRVQDDASVRVESGGEGGIRTPGRSFSPYNGLANRRLQPLGHLSAEFALAIVTYGRIWRYRLCCRNHRIDGARYQIRYSGLGRACDPVR